MTRVRDAFCLFPQQEGPDVRLRVRGDEHYSVRETPSGYSVVYDEQLGLYTYALVVGGMFVSSGFSIASPPPPGLPKGLREAIDVRQTKLGLSLSRSGPPPDTKTETFGPQNGLLEGRRVALGRVTGLTILVEFEDVRTKITAADVEAMLNADDYRRNGNFSSVRSYFSLMSSGKLDYHNVVVGPYRLGRKRSRYIQRPVLRDALDAVVADKGRDFLAQFDSRDEGIIDAVNVLYAGGVLYEGELWPHNHYQVLRYGDYRTYFYMLTNLGRAPVDLAIGTFCHESGHLLCRWPDLYDYGDRDRDYEESSGIGHYCLMGSGNHRNHGRTPAPVSPYLRHLVRWTSLENVTGHRGSIELQHGRYDKAYRFETGRKNEYFILENRSRLDIDAHQEASGLAVYHCDTKGSNEWQQGTAERHYQCALLQADGHRSLERGRNEGDAGDLFGELPGVALSFHTVPSSRDWKGKDIGMLVRNVSKPGRVMTVELGEPDPACEYSSDPWALIDDNDSVSDTINVSEGIASLSRVVVDVHITHSYIGDLRLVLTSPAGTEVVLRDQEGEGQDDIEEQYDTESNKELGTILGEGSDGEWTLRVEDHAAQDIGRLNYWMLTIR